MKLRTVVVAVVISLTTSSAWAECAWVLWSVTQMDNTDARTPHDSFEKRAACVAALDERQKKAVKSPEEYVRINETKLISLSSPRLTFLRCGVCGGNMISNPTRGKRGRPQIRYVCSVHKHRPGACSNKYGVPVAALDDAVLAQLRHYLDFAVMTDRLTAMIAAPAAHMAEREQVAGIVADLDRRISKLLDLYETADVPDVAARLKDLRRQRDDAKARLEHLDGLTIGELPDFTTEKGRAAWADSIRPALAELHATLTSDPVKARQRLREVLGGTITVTPILDGGALTFDVRGVSSFEAIKVSVEDGSYHGTSTVTRAFTVAVTRQAAVSGRNVVAPG